MAVERRGRPITRMLVALFEGDEASGLAQLMRLIALARLQGAAARVAYFHRIPRERMDRHDRVVADRYREMLRIEESMREAVARVLRGAGRAPVEVVVRFGAPVVEVAREAEAFGADAVGFAPGTDLKSRWRVWRIRRRFAASPGVRLVVLESPPGVRAGADVAMRPA